ncbi:hypothetical protein OF83DRAFT_1071373 [Amylostereum chailletii]|nr:hypothetical protein OF83DRAFT_1071373 [Amylostereum chailletii]
MSSYNTSSLQDWFQAHLTAIYAAPSEDARNDALDAFFASSAEISVESQAQGLEEMKQKINTQSNASKSIQVTWEGGRESLSSTSTSSLPTGKLEGSYTLKHSSKIRLRAAPMVHYTKVSFVATIDEDPQAQGEDKRRVLSLQQTETIERPPVNIHPIRQSAEEEE